jgi:hypothetical protein
MIDIGQSLEGFYRSRLQGNVLDGSADLAVRNQYARLAEVMESLRPRVSREPILTRQALKRKSVDCIDFGEADRIDVPPLYDVFAVDSFRQIKRPSWGRYWWDQPFVSEIRHGTILAGSGLVVDEDHMLIADLAVSAIPVLRSHAGGPRALNLDTTTDGELPSFEIAIPFTSFNTSTGNYWRWVHDYIPRIEGVFQYIRHRDVRPELIVRDDAPDYVHDTFEFFGLDRYLSYWDATSAATVERVIVPTNRYPERHASRGPRVLDKLISPGVARFLREQVERRSKLPDFDTPRILIVRSDAGRREIANRHEVEAYLAARGFVTYELARMSFAEQAALFAQAEHVVGVTGAGMTNMLFSEDCIFSVIYGDVLAASFYYLAQCLPVKFQPVIGKSVGIEKVDIMNQKILVEPQAIPLGDA